VFVLGTNQLRIAAALSPVVWFFITFFYVIAWPIATLLDRLLGVEEDDGRSKTKKHISKLKNQKQQIQKQTIEELGSIRIGARQPGNQATRQPPPTLTKY
jgi:hypothetical protein